MNSTVPESATIQRLALINIVTIHWVWLVLGWVTIFGQVYHLGM